MYIKPADSWRQLAAKVAQETDPKKLAKLTDELLRALEGQKRDLYTDQSPRQS
jgi:hypothetical protein